MIHQLYEWQSTINIIRLIACMAILGYACLTDWKVRRAPNELWIALGAIGVVLDAIEFWAGDFNYLYIVFLIIGVGFIYVLVYVIFKVGGFGGADAKALIAIAIVFPFPLYPIINIGGVWFPIAYQLHSPIFALTVLGNAVTIMLIIPLFVLLYNLLNVPIGELAKNPIGALTGYKMNIDRIKGRHLRLMHRYTEEEDGRMSIKMAFRGNEADDEMLARLEKWSGEGKIGDRVWVTPKLPFLIPITIGLIIAVLYGDILMQIVAFLMGR